MKTLWLAAATSVLCAIPVQRAHAHAGDNDPSFGQGGSIVLPNYLPASPFDWGDKVVIQPDGKILLVGRAGGDSSGIWRAAFAVTRLNTDGTIDTSFGPDADGSFVLAWADGPAEAHAIAFDTDGDLVVGGNVANLAGIVWLTPNGVIDTAKGQDGTFEFATNGDTANQTTLSGLLVISNPNAPNSIVFAGTYNGSGHQQVAIGYYNYNQADIDPVLVQAFDMAGSSGIQSVATSVLFEPTFAPSPSLIVGGYADYADADGHHTNCVVEDFDVIGQFDNNGNLYYTWASGTSWAGRFSTSDSPEAECFVDAMAPTGLGDYVIAAGREIMDSDGSWRAMYFELEQNQQDYTFDLQPYRNVLQLTPWGDNSIREVLPEDNAKWAFAGFTGVDPTDTDDPFTARVNFLDGSLDGTFGSNGVAMHDFDPGDYAYGKTFGAALDAHGCIVSVGTYWTGDSGESGNDVTAIFVTRVLGDGGPSSDTIFANGFDPAVSACGAP